MMHEHISPFISIDLHDHITHPIFISLSSILKQILFRNKPFKHPANSILACLDRPGDLLFRIDKARMQRV